MKPEKKERIVLTNVIETELDILKRHVLVLQTLKLNEPAGIIKLSELTKHPQHMVRYSLRILEQEGLIEPSPQGAVTTESATERIEQERQPGMPGSNEIHEPVRRVQERRAAEDIGPMKHDRIRQAERAAYAADESI
jgi:predicted transcriptional regulator